MITSDQVERFIEACKKGRETYAPIKCILFDFGEKPYACITGAALVGMGWDVQPYLELSEGARGRIELVRDAAGEILKALGVDPHQIVNDTRGLPYKLKNAIPSSYDSPDVSDERFYEWLRGLVAQE